MALKSCGKSAQLLAVYHLSPGANAFIGVAARISTLLGDPLSPSTVPIGRKKSGTARGDAGQVNCRLCIGGRGIRVPLAPWMQFPPFIRNALANGLPYSTSIDIICMNVLWVAYESYGYYTILTVVAV
jgi:hypothetical protein